MTFTRFPLRIALAITCVLCGLAFVAARIGVNAQQPATPPQTEKKDELILKPEAKVSFTTDEGTWMSVDVSPDGQTLVFDLVGDLYTMPINGGEAKRIVGDMSFETQPRFSPDGKWVVFTSDRSGADQLWLCKPDGSEPKPLTKGRGAGMLSYLSPSWTPDGNYILASKSERGIGTFHVYLWHKDGGTGVSVGSSTCPRRARSGRTSCTATQQNGRNRLA